MILMQVDWGTVGVLGGIMGVPLTLIALYMRTLRDVSTSGLNEVKEGMQRIHSRVDRCFDKIEATDRRKADYEAFVRESMRARQSMERLSENMAALNAKMETETSIGRQIGQQTQALIGMAESQSRKAG